MGREVGGKPVAGGCPEDPVWPWWAWWLRHQTKEGDNEVCGLGAGLRDFPASKPSVVGQVGEGVCSPSH